ncbi:uncharacterized protein LOC133184925 [Saccostrea echinata]|uniref:uncharacterized protein LOC133184925 n=1 Tax=Saccostrea echinata TaxID=191078 RepID=UPI002A81C61C|nr:uncharacterized protein LOC133184925 [Saccostrea echinata]
MVHKQHVGDKDGRTRNIEVLSSLSLNHNRQRSGDHRKDRRSKSHPHVRVKNQLRYPSDGDIGKFLKVSSDENLPRLPFLRPGSEDAIARKRRILRKFSTSYNISKKFWNKIVDENRADEGQMERWSKIKSTVSLGTVISRAFGESKDKKKIINPFKLRHEIKKRKLYSLFRFAGRLTILCSRLAKTHSLRFREDDDDISPYIKGLTFHDYDNQPDLMFDKSQYKAKKSIRVPEETKRILSKPPSQRTEQELYSALLTLRNIEAFAAYPNRMQKMIVEVGQYERFEAKRIVVRQGHPGSSYYFMLSGAAVVMVMEDPNSYARPIKHLEKGMDFGEIALTLNIRRQGTIITKEPCELMSIGRRDYQRIFMAGGVRSIQDPDQEKFLRHLPFLHNWPIHLLPDAGDKTHFLFFKRGATIVKETNLSQWIVIVKSGSISILKRLKRVVPFEWKQKKEIKFVTEKEKRDNYAKRLVLRRHILSELKIPLKGNSVDDEDNQFEDFPGKYKIFIHPGEGPNVESSETTTPLVDGLPDIKENNSKKSSFQNIQRRLLPKLSETSREENEEDNPLFSNMNKSERHPVFGIQREETSFDILAPLPSKKKLQERQSNRRESILEKEREMMGFEEKTRTVQDDLDNVVKDPDELTLADLNPEFVRVQTLIKGQVFGLSDLILEQKTNFSIVSNGADVILIDQQFYLKHAPEKLLSKMRQELCPYPTDEDLQTRLQQSVDWDAYRTDTMSNTLKYLETRRQLRHSLKV